MAADAGISLTHLAQAFVVRHPAVTSAIIGPRTMEQLTDLLAGQDVVLDDATLDRIDELVPPGTNVHQGDAGWTSPALAADARRRPVECSGALPPARTRRSPRWTSGGTMGGGQALEIARRLGPDDTIEEIGTAGLRGRGGAGFPTARKWAGVLASGGTHRYVVCNAAEGEPSSFKDRALLRANPYQVLEGLTVAALTIGAREAYVAIKRSFVPELERLLDALEQMEAAGLAGDIAIKVVGGPDEYLFGEEKAMLEVIEGKPPMPRLLPPYEHGLFATGSQMGWESIPREPGHGPERATCPTPRW